MKDSGSQILPSAQHKENPMQSQFCSPPCFQAQSEITFHALLMKIISIS
jgi:hypothetical protein